MLLPLCVLSALALSDATVDHPPRQALAPSGDRRLHPSLHRQRSFALKFHDARPVRRAAGAFVGEIDLLDVNALLAGVDVARYFERPVDDLDRERESLLPRVPVGLTLPADLNNYYRVHTGDASQTEALVEALNDLDVVEVAYYEPSLAAAIALGGDLPPTTPMFEGQQGYLDSAPLGLGWRTFQNVVGARGEDLLVSHIEFDWDFDHEDACRLVPSSLINASPGVAAFAPHGTAVAGILTCDRNGFGVRGMSNGADLLLGSVLTAPSAAALISNVTAVANPGDVIVSSFAWVLASGGQAPIDFFQAEFDAIFTAATKGIVYCFGAGNANQDLGDTALFGNRYLPTSPDSGGVIVGGGLSGNLNKWPSSNFGSRVDCHAWAEDITVIGGTPDLFNPGDVKQHYTSSFGGTSGAGPQVAGVAAALSNAVREQNGVQLTAFEIRDRLRTSGTPQGGGAPIGPRPDLAALLAAYGLPDGLLLQGDGELGQPATLELSGPPQASVILFFSAGRGRFPVGLNRDFLLDPTQLVSFHGVTLDAAGEQTVGGTVPNDATLSGDSFFIQAARFGAGPTTLTNSVELWIRP